MRGKPPAPAPAPPAAACAALLLPPPAPLSSAAGDGDAGVTHDDTIGDNDDDAPWPRVQLRVGRRRGAQSAPPGDGGRDCGFVFVPGHEVDANLVVRLRASGLGGGLGAGELARRAYAVLAAATADDDKSEMTPVLWRSPPARARRRRSLARSLARSRARAHSRTHARTRSLALALALRDVTTSPHARARSRCSRRSVVTWRSPPARAPPPGGGRSLARSARVAAAAFQGASRGAIATPLRPVVIPSRPPVSSLVAVADSERRAPPTPSGRVGASV